MKPYSILLMDADETLLDFRRSEGCALATTLLEHGIEMTPAIHDRYHEINRVLWQQLERREMTRERLKVQRFEELFDAIGIAGMDAVDFNRRYMAAIGKHGFMLPGALDLLRDLHERFDIHIITNGTASVQHTRLADSGLLPLVDRVFISEEVGADKPSPAFFNTVLSAIGNPDKRELLIVGDSLTSDICGGILSGIDTCWFNPECLNPPADIRPTYQVSSYDALRRLLF